MRRGLVSIVVAAGLALAAIAPALGVQLARGTGSIREEAGRIAASSTTRVRMKDDVFRPGTVTIASGSRVKWVNVGSSPHTTTSTKGLWDKTLSPGESWARTFKRAGTFRYYCRFHSGMTGKVVVT